MAVLSASLVVGGGALADAVMSAIGFAAILQASNYVAWFFALAAGLITTGFVIATRYVFSSRCPWIFRVPWFVCALLDIYTSLACTDHFVIRQKDFDSILEMSGEFPDPVQAIVAFVVAGVFMSCAGAVPYVFELLPD